MSNCFPPYRFMWIGYPMYEVIEYLVNIALLFSDRRIDIARKSKFVYHIYYKTSITAIRISSLKDITFFRNSSNLTNLCNTLIIKYPNIIPERSLYKTIKKKNTYAITHGMK